MENYSKVLIAKIPILFILMALTYIIPRNEEISALADRLREERSKMNSKDNKNNHNGKTPMQPVVDDEEATPLMMEEIGTVQNEGGSTSNRNQRRFRQDYYNDSNGESQYDQFYDRQP